MILILLPRMEISAKTEVKSFTTGVTVGGEANTAGSAVTMPAGWAGMRITVGPKPVKVTALGRMYTSQSNATHNFLITDTDGAIVAQGISSTAQAGTPEDSFVYGEIASPVTLSANTSYYLVSDYWGAEDKFYSSAVSEHTDVATLDGIVILESGAWKYYEAENIGWGPMDFKYEEEIDERPSPKPGDLVKYVTSVANSDPGNTAGSPVVMPEGWAGMRITVGDKDITVTSLGRWHTPESAASHNFLIVDMDGGLVLDYGSAVATAGQDAPEGFVYGTLASPVTLSANTPYYIVSDYIGNTDKFYAGSVAEHTDVASLDGIVILNGSEWEYTPAEKTGWGPLDFEYEEPEETTPTPTPTVTPTPTPDSGEMPSPKPTAKPTAEPTAEPGTTPKPTAKP
ncbi:MAG: hypothetical protein IJL71_05480, partial [Oscillospiraceae bacterium]|nr:hypothetical protein [Oscillospiraceae bacterium]